jgi:glycosyltransferase involved in cell wall biosynthesis
LTRIAVVIPCFDDGATVRETVASVTRQPEECELVVVDDGSTEEGTLAALAELERDGVRVVRRENGGLARARMTGVEATTAPYVFPLDADDLLEPGAASRLADALDRAPRAGVAWGDVSVFGDFELQLQPARAFDPWRLTFLNQIPGTSLVRRSALLEAGGWQLANGYEDWDLWLSLAEHGWSGVYVPGPMLRYRRHGTRMLGDCVPRHDELVAELRRRHEALFASRPGRRRSSPAPLPLKWAFSLVAAAPLLSSFDRHRLYLFASSPRQVVRMRRLRRAAAA